MSKGRAEIRQRIKNGISESNTNDRIRIRRSKKKESNITLEHYKQYMSILFVILCISGVCGYFGYQYYLYYKINLVRQPLQMDKILQTDINDKSLFWGTYRPQLYFGVKHRSPASLLAGLMWFNQLGRQQAPNIRYWCNSNDKLSTFNWELHDLRNFGKQRIVDSRQIITTSFLKNGDDWISRIEVTAKSHVETSLLWYTYLPDSVRGYIRPIMEQDRLVGLQGSTVELGDFKISFNYRYNKQNKNRNRESFLITNVQREDKVLQAIEAGMGYDDSTRQLRLVGHMPLPRTISENIWVFEMTGDGDFVLDIVFESANDKSDRLTSDTFQQQFDKHVERFHEKFHSLFRIEPGAVFSQKQIELAKSALSNLVGGVGYFYGSSIVRSQWSNEENQALLYWPNSLFTSTPSRTQFPRGFLWDEGFHCLLLGRWDPLATFEIIGSWLDLLNIEGWIPREQILGWEARARVPDEFVIQDNRIGNPPTLVLCLEDFDERFDLLDKDTQVAFKNFLSKALPRLETWYRWFNSTQLGEGFGNYQWKGRNVNNNRHLNPLTLQSGLDDYPRASHPSEIERHLDLRCWMTMFSRVLVKLRKRVELNPEPYLGWSKILSDENLLNDAHWDAEKQMYADYGLHTESVSLIRPPPVESHNAQHQNVHQDKIRKVSQAPKLSFVPHFGYVNLFPLIMKILSPSSPKLGAILNDLENPNLLWTNFGLRSLSKNSSFYQRHNSEHDPPYWRGAIWININYLTIRSLAHYSKLIGPYQNKSRQLYQNLMVNVVNNVLGQMKQTGFMWEQYDDSTGKGQRAHPFAGWTSLVVMSMAHL